MSKSYKHDLVVSWLPVDNLPEDAAWALPSRTGYRWDGTFSVKSTF